MTTAINPAPVRTTDMKLEVIVIPVSDVNRAKQFYGGLGWRLDADFASGDDWRAVQFTPPGSGASVIFGKNLTPAAPGSAQGLYLVVSDIEAARQELLRRGVKVSETFHGAGDVYTGTDEPYLFGSIRVSGPDPEHRSYRSHASFRDPDGNGLPACSLTMYSAYQSGQFTSCSPVRFSCSPCAAAARRSVAARSAADVKVVSASTRPGRRLVTSWSSQPLPSGSLKEACER